jgi:hypothetical protein
MPAADWTARHVLSARPCADVRVAERIAERDATLKAAALAPQNAEPVSAIVTDDVPVKRRSAREACRRR